MFERYRHKIKSVAEIKALIGQRPRVRKVAMCHGVFDILHPGHVRHLDFARSHCDVLIASLTCDEHIMKGDGRPYVPHELRAANLAALEAVDYVIIDHDPDPLANIGVLQPDFFVKGFEYAAAGVHPKTRREMDAISAYGGELLFSPGDIVYSSTKLLAMHKPELSLEKLVVLMQAEGVSFRRLHELLGRFAGAKVHIIGDMIVDKYSHCTLLGPSTKTPTFSIKLENCTSFVGGAGVVAKHLKSLGADVVFTTVLGADALADFVIADMEAAGVTLNVVRDPTRPTTQKERFWASGYKLLQVDTVENRPIAAPLVETISKALQTIQTEMVIFSDFRHGIFHSESIDELTRNIPADALKIADSQVSNRWGNILDFKGFDLITPNQHEARFALGDQDSQTFHLGRRLLEQSGAANVLLKLGERGVFAYSEVRYESGRNFFYVDSFAQDVVDAVGAGDAMLASAALAMLRQAKMPEFAIIGSLAAALACEIEGNVPITLEQLQEKLQRVEHIAKNPLHS